MDKKTWKALNANDFPNIYFHLTDFENVQPVDGLFNTKVSGKLTIAGVKNVIQFSVKGKELANNQIEIIGSKTLKMTDYGIKPPKALMGALTTGDEVTVDFRVILNHN